jgi:hypothetical protein
MKRIKATSIFLRYADDEGPGYKDGQCFTDLNDMGRRFGSVETKKGRSARIKFSDGSELKANANENSWSAFGLTAEGIRWESREYESLNALISHMQTRKTESANHTKPPREVMDAFYRSQILE